MPRIGYNYLRFIACMWKNYLKTAIRSLKNQRFYTLNNILGLAIGFAAALYIFQYTHFHKNFDAHIPGKEHKARLLIAKYRDGEKTLASAETYVGCGPAMANKIPEVSGYTRTFNMAAKMNAVISYEPENISPIHLKLKDFYYADGNFLNFFGYELLRGETDSALARPYTAVITESLAKVYFGNEDPLGKVLRYQDEGMIDDEHIITGVMKDPPPNTHLPFSLLLSYNTFDTRPHPDYYKDSWKVRAAYTYVSLVPGADLAVVNNKLPDLIKQNKDLREGRKEILKLQPVKNIHFTQDIADQAVPVADKQLLSIFEWVAVLILFIAGINYINLSTSTLVSRANEVGVRKVLGAAKRHLILQYYVQCGIINFLAFVLAMIILYIGRPYLNDLAGSAIPASALTDWYFIRMALLIFLATTLLSGLMPAMIIGTFDPIKAISGALRLKGGKRYRQMLIMVQFIVSFCLIMATLIVFKQLRHMQNENLGIDIDQVIVVRVPGVLGDVKSNQMIYNLYRRFIDLSEANNHVKSGSYSLTVPGHERAFRTGAHLQSNPEEGSTFRFNASGAGFADTYGLKLLAGRNFRENVSNDSVIILSESAVEALGFANEDEAIGAMVQVPAFRLTCEIVGVVNDYRLESVKTDPEPMAFLNFEPFKTNFFSFRIGDNVQASLDHISSAWNEVFPGNPLDYFFLDDYFNRQYEQERNLSQLFAVFGLIAMVLAAMGLLGLSAYTVQQRTKEIGVRKALGSSVFQIFKLLSVSLIFLVILASALGAGVVYYFADQWMSQFPSRTVIQPWLYLVPMAILLIVTVLSISYQTLHAARANPVDSLRYE
ncbi:MAG: FtsX-like permease family protein [Fulvivirga sp.]|nr:FtsX-like permease family protein [Fulvivirga sp.]